MKILPKGLVLAGGKSKRLGRDKVVEQVSGVTLLQRTCAVLAEVVDEVWVSGRNPAGLGVDAPWLPDDFPGCGPMGGILTGLRRLEAPLLVLACDLPFMDAATLRRLLSFREERPTGAVMTTYRQTETGFIESLVAIYEPAAADLLEEALSRGCYKTSSAVPESLRQTIPYSQDAADVFFNINHPADLAILKRVKSLSGVS